MYLCPVVSVSMCLLASDLSDSSAYICLCMYVYMLLHYGHINVL